MAGKTKADKLDMDVEKALEQALDFEFDDDALEAILASKPGSVFQDELVDLQNVDLLGGDDTVDLSPPPHKEETADDVSFDLDLEILEQQISRAAQELASEHEEHEEHEADVILLDDSAASKSFAEELAAQAAEVEAEVDVDVDVEPNTPALQADSQDNEQDYTPASAAEAEAITAALFKSKPSIIKPSALSHPSSSQDLPKQPLIVAKKLGEPLEKPAAPTNMDEERAEETFPSVAAPAPRSAALARKKNRKRRRVFSSYWTTTALSLLWAAGGVATGVHLAPVEAGALETLTAFLSGATGMLVTERLCRLPCSGVLPNWRAARVS